MDMDVAHRFIGRKLRIWFIIELLAGDDMGVNSGGGQMESEVADELTGCGMVGKEESIEEDDALHRSVARWQGAAVQALRSSHYRIFTRHLHRDGSTLDLEQDLSATGIVEAPCNTARSAKGPATRRAFESSCDTEQGYAPCALQAYA